MLIVLATAGLPFQESAVSAAWRRAGFPFPRLLHLHLLQEFTLSTSVSLVAVRDRAPLQACGIPSTQRSDDFLHFHLAAIGGTRILPPFLLLLLALCVFPGLFLICIRHPIWLPVGLCEQLNGLSGRAGNKGMGKERRGRMEEEPLKPTLLLRQMFDLCF